MDALQSQIRSLSQNTAAIRSRLKAARLVPGVPHAHISCMERNLILMEQRLVRLMIIEGRQSDFPHALTRATG
jgi:hypothetical protein